MLLLTWFILVSFSMKWEFAQRSRASCTSNSNSAKKCLFGWLAELLKPHEAAKYFAFCKVAVTGFQCLPVSNHPVDIKLSLFFKRFILVSPFDIPTNAIQHFNCQEKLFSKNGPGLKIPVLRTKWFDIFERESFFLNLLFLFWSWKRKWKLYVAVSPFNNKSRRDHKAFTESKVSGCGCPISF